MQRRLGKALEWEYLQCWKIVHSGQSSFTCEELLYTDHRSVDREWHFKPENAGLSLEQLRQHLIDAMRLFPHLRITQNLDMTATQQTSQFATIMEQLEE
jgi:hypothetical protein